MKIPILIEVTENDRPRATRGEPFAPAVEADTPEAPLHKMRRGIVERMAQGGRIAALDLPGGSHPWHRVLGMFQDDPLFDEWQQAISHNRRIVDGDLVRTETLPPCRAFCGNSAPAGAVPIPRAAAPPAPSGTPPCSHPHSARALPHLISYHTVPDVSSPPTPVDRIFTDVGNDGT